jgi:hypothetical protein
MGATLRPRLTDRSRSFTPELAIGLDQERQVMWKGNARGVKDGSTKDARQTESEGVVACFLMCISPSCQGHPLIGKHQEHSHRRGRLRVSSYTFQYVAQTWFLSPAKIARRPVYIPHLLSTSGPTRPCLPGSPLQPSTAQARMQRPGRLFGRLGA